VQDGIGDMRVPSLAPMLSSRRQLGESAGPPPEHERHRVDRDLRVALLLASSGVEPEEGGDEIAEVLDDVLILLCDAEAEPLRMQ